MMSRNSVHQRTLDHGHSPSRLRTTCAHGPISCSLFVLTSASRKETRMKRLALLVALLLACSSSPLGLHDPGGGSPGAGGASGSVAGPPSSGGALGNGGAGGIDDTPATGGMPGTGGHTVLPLASGGSPGNGTGGGMGGANMGAGGILGTGGAVGSGGTHGSGGVGGTGGTTGSTGVYGMPCTTNLDCPSDAVCCDGSDEACDDTRLPAGDGTNPGEFVVSADELTVTDTITGLFWQRDGSGVRPACTTDRTNLTCTRAEAHAYCASLTLGGVSGWRVPARNELVTIVDFTKTNPPSIDETAFPNTPVDWFQTSSSDASAGGSNWNVGFYDGRSDGSDVGRVRCVRGSRCFPINRFAMLDGGLVRDTLTSLVWQQQTGPSMTWSAAQTYCSTRGLGFRVPTTKELISLVDLTVTSGETINQVAFPNMPVAPFWTSSPNETSSGTPWHVGFGWGGYSDGWDLVGEAAVVRCLR